MADIITESQLRSNRLQKGTRNFTELSSKRRNRTLHEAIGRGEITIFLSHSHSDQSLIEDTVQLIGEHVGVSVYVDWLDEGMPEITTGETAGRIKEKISSCRKFLVLASSAAIKSNWVNWEIGYGDAKKYPIHFALFPVKVNNQSWTNAEYLQLYSYIVVEESQTDTFPSATLRKLFVRNPNGIQVPLINWLNGS